MKEIFKRVYGGRSEEGGGGGGGLGVSLGDSQNML